MRWLLALALGLAVSLTACADDDPPATDGASDHAADVAFATELMHRDAALLNLLDVGLGRPLPDEVIETTDRLRLETTERIERAADLFEEWGEKAPVTVRDHSAGHSSDHDVPTLEGMPTGEDLQELGGLSRKAFEPAFRSLLVDTLESTMALSDAVSGGDVAALASDASASCEAAIEGL
jgi:hypothetical protein